MNFVYELEIFEPFVDKPPFIVNYIKNGFYSSLNKCIRVINDFINDYEILLKFDELNSKETYINRILVHYGKISTVENDIEIAYVRIWKILIN